MDNVYSNEWSSRKSCLELHVHIDDSESSKKLEFKNNVYQAGDTLLLKWDFFQILLLNFVTEIPSSKVKYQPRSKNCF